MLNKISAKFINADKKTIILVSIIIILVLVLGLGVLAENWKIKNFSAGYFNTNKPGYSLVQRKNSQNYPSSDISDDSGQSIIPQDAAKVGELAIMVDNLDNAKNGIVDIAVKNGGNIYTTSISYLSGNIKNGSIVIQVPAENFDATFKDLNKISSQVVQEETKQIPVRNSFIYPQPLPMSAVVNESAPTKDNSSTSTSDNTTTSKKTTNTDKTTSATSETEVTSPALVAPMPVYKPIAQDKGYIKVIFVDYGVNGYGNIVNRPSVTNVFGIGYTGQNMRNNIWVVLAIKSILLIILIVILFIIAKKIIQHLRILKKNKSTTHGVRQSAKIHARITKTKKI